MIRTDQTRLNVLNERKNFINSILRNLKSGGEQAICDVEIRLLLRHWNIRDLIRTFHAQHKRVDVLLRGLGIPAI